ncbi:ABC transporter substrate-binding protein [Streptomyces sp. 796.1]|uniref:ABC transporter substrate-binding protein n=1 Tax=Streptomyces sp. 796.1 TaxID=3163029 RepID=UPI0039C99F5B
MPVDGVTRGPVARTRRCVALFAAGVLLPLPVVAGCSSGGDEDAAAAPAAHDVASAARADLSGRGTLRWALDAAPATLNAYRADADAGTDRVAGAVLPLLFTLDQQGRPQRNPDYLESAEVIDREPRQVVGYRLNPKAVWSNGRALGVADFRAQWRALRGKDAAYRAARNAGYERIERIAPGEEPGEIEVTFRRPYADWRALFAPLYPKEAMATPSAFNEGSRRQLPLTAGPFTFSDGNSPAAAGRTAGSAGERVGHGEQRDERPEEPDEPAEQQEKQEKQEKPEKPAADSAGAGKSDDSEKSDEAGNAEDAAPAKAAGKGKGKGKAKRKGAARTPITLVRNPRWWGESARLDQLVFKPVPRAERAAALIAGRLDVAEVDAATADRIARAGGSLAAGAKGGARPAQGAPPGGGPGEAAGPPPLLAPARTTLTGTAGALRSWVIEYGPRPAKDTALKAIAAERAAAARRAAEARALATFTVRRSLEPAYTQLALNGTAGPLADERVRRAVARAIDRAALTEAVYAPLGLSGKPLGSHLRVAGQHGYRDNSGALGSRNTAAARSLLADAGWQPGTAGAARSAGAKPDAAHGKAQDKARDAGKHGDAGAPNAAGSRPPKPEQPPHRPDHPDRPKPGPSGDRDHADRPKPPRPGSPAGPEQEQGQRPEQEEQAAGAGRAAAPAAGPGLERDQPERDRPRGQAPAEGPARGTQAGPRLLPGGAPIRVKDGQPLLLRFVLPTGAGTEQAAEVGERIVRMLGRIGVQTDVVKVAKDRYFSDYVARGDFDLALYSWPATAFPATDARPIFAKPRPASDGSLLVEQNYSRVGTDQIDQLFEQASSELDPDAAAKLLRRADARIWAAAGSLPLYQRPQLVAVRSGLANVGAFGLQTPHYQDIGYARAEDAKPDGE